MIVSVDIVLPCYNPNDSWPEELISFHKFISDRFHLKYFVVNDGSVKGNISAQVQSLIHRGIPVTLTGYETNQGKGHALRYGVQQTISEYVMYTDIDFPFTNGSMLSVLTSLTSGEADIIAGSRNESYYLKNISAFRKTLSRGFRFFIRKFIKMPFTDTQCGLKGFNKTGKQIFLSTRINRYLFDFEFIYLASRNREVKLLPVEVSLKENVILSQMHVKILLQELLNLVRVLTLSANR